VVFTLLRRFSTLKFSGVVFIFTLPQSAYFEFMEEGRKSDSQHYADTASYLSNNTSLFSQSTIYTFFLYITPLIY